MLDIVCIIADIIIAGNVRRSATMGIGDHDDIDFLLAKRWDLGNVPPWRCRSNNSVVCEDVDDLSPLFWDTYEKPTEPIGLINLRLLQTNGRTGEPCNDFEVRGTNPCGEQGLASWETCCLAEVFLPNVETKHEFIDIV